MRPAASLPPESVRRLMQLGTLYRFEAIVEGMPELKAAAPLSEDEIAGVRGIGHAGGASISRT